MVGSFSEKPIRAVPGTGVWTPGGAPCPPQLMNAWRDKKGIIFRQGYGLTETSPYCTVSTLKSHLKELPEEERRRVIARTGRARLLASDRGSNVSPMAQYTRQ